jgi:hypothetical protein
VFNNLLQHSSTIRCKQLQQFVAVLGLSAAALRDQSDPDHVSAIDLNLELLQVGSSELPQDWRRSDLDPVRSHCVDPFAGLGPTGARKG